MKSNPPKRIFAVNQEFKQFEQVEKNQKYLLAEHESLEEFDEEFDFEDSKFEDSQFEDCPRCGGSGCSDEDFAECRLCDGDGFLYN